MHAESGALPKSEHFKLHQVAEGVYAAIALEGKAAYSNAGIIDLGDQTLIFDTFETHMAAQDLKQAAEHLTGRPATWVIISHAHPDHWMGNQVFAEQAPILATQGTRAAMHMVADDIHETQANPAELELIIRQEEEHLEAEKDARRRVSLQISISRWRYMLAMLPDLKLRFPNLTFDGKLVFYGRQRNAELVSVSHAHTPNDCYLQLPADKIAFLGDLGFFKSQPFMAYCDPPGWMARLEEIEQSDFETLVPGHGPLGSRSDLALQRHYITVLEERVGQIIKEGGTAEDALKLSLPKPFDAWLDRGLARFEANVRSRYQRLAGEPGVG